MNYEVAAIPLFDKQVRILAKKHPSLKQDLLLLIEQLATNPIQGKALGNSFYKIRLAIRSKGRGKSGGARIITYVKVVKSTVYLASIYDKSEKETISEEELRAVFQSIP